MDQQKIIDFFNKASADWDSIANDNTEKINRILDYSDFRGNPNVLDVACGTGVLTPFLSEHGASHITGIDISPEMIKLAKAKFLHYNNVDFINISAEDICLNQKFDRIIIFDAFPHFCHKEKVIESVAKHIKLDGRLTIAHSMGRAQLDELHRRTAGQVSDKMLSGTELAELLSTHFHTDTIIDEDDIFVVSAIPKHRTKNV